MADEATRRYEAMLQEVESLRQMTISLQAELRAASASVAASELAKSASAGREETLRREAEALRHVATAALNAELKARPTTPVLPPKPRSPGPRSSSLPLARSLSSPPVNGARAASGNSQQLPHSPARTYDLQFVADAASANLRCMRYDTPLQAAPIAACGVAAAAAPTISAPLAEVTSAVAASLPPRPPPIFPPYDHGSSRRKSPRKASIASTPETMRATASLAAPSCNLEASGSRNDVNSEGFRAEAAPLEAPEQVTSVFSAPSRAATLHSGAREAAADYVPLLFGPLQYAPRHQEPPSSSEVSGTRACARREATYQSSLALCGSRSAPSSLERQRDARLQVYEQLKELRLRKEEMRQAW